MKPGSQVLRLGSRYLYPLSHLMGTKVVVLKELLVGRAINPSTGEAEAGGYL